MLWTAIPALAVGDPFAKPTYDALKGDLEYLKGDAAWTDVVFAAGWSNTGAGYAPVSYRRVGDYLSFRGLATTSSGATTSVFTLPVGSRPPYNHISAAANSGSPDVVYVLATGLVRAGVTPALGSYFSFDGVLVPML